MAGIGQYIESLRSSPEVTRPEIDPGILLTLQFFSEFTRIPRPSGGEGEMRRCLVNLAEGMGWPYEKDPAGNLLIEIPPSLGYENTPGVILQGHMDMKCVKDKGAPLNPATAGVMTQLDESGKWVSADRTTLGADDAGGDAIAVALGMRIDQTQKHGPLALLFTVNEEEGLIGAQHMGFKNGLEFYKYLLNLDNEKIDEGVIGGAGSAASEMALTVEREEQSEEMVHVSVTVAGGLGGHSGVEIDKKHINAIKVLAAALSSI